MCLNGHWRNKSNYFLITPLVCCSSVQSLSCNRLFVTSWTAARQASLASPVHRPLLEFAQTHVQWVSDWHPTFSSSVVHFSSCLQSFPASGSFPMSQFFTSGGQSIGASASVIPMNIQGWFLLGLNGLTSLLCKGLSRVFFSLAPKFESINSSVLSLLYGPTLTSVHDYWKNHSFDCMDLFWQSDVSAF